MKRNIIFGALVAAFTIVGCSKWTSPEALDFTEPIRRPSEKDLSAIRTFKKTAHKVTLLTIDGTSEAPVSRKQHPMAFPDSADYICVRIADGLHPTIVSELAEVRTKKGTKSLYYLDYSLIANAWSAIQDAKEEAHEPLGTDEDYKAYLKAQAAEKLANCVRYGFDGVFVTYSGKSTEVTGYNEALEEWMAANPGREVVVFGNNTRYLSESILQGCKYVVISVNTSSSDAYTTGMMTTTVNSIGRLFPVKDRFLIEVYIPNDDHPQAEGYAPQPVVGAEWTLLADDKYAHCGLCIVNAGDDYGPESTFNIIRKAISVMNK